jgi:hypothetical protein
MTMLAADLAWSVSEAMYESRTRQKNRPFSNFCARLHCDACTVGTFTLMMHHKMPNAAVQRAATGAEGGC